VEGGAQLPARFGGGPRTETKLTWTLPHGFFNTKNVRPELYNTLREQRFGETAKSTFHCWVETEVIKGIAPEKFPEITLNRVVKPVDPSKRYHHSIAIENATSTTAASGTTISTSFTANTGSNRAALVVAGTDRSGQVGTHTVTYGGASTSITRPWNVTDNNYSRCTGDVFIDSEIGSGAKTVQNVADLSCDGGLTLAVLCLSGVDQTTPVGTGQSTAGTSTGSNITVTVTSVNSTDVVVDGAYKFGSSITVGTDETSQTSANDGSNFTMISTQPGSSGGVMGMGVGSAAEYSFGAVAFKEAAAGTTVRRYSLPTLGVG
jgi:hypothetical protein